jgi:hypothetical protein
MTLEQDAVYLKKLADYMDQLAKLLPDTHITAEEQVDLEDDIYALEDYFGMFQEHVESIDASFDSIFDNFVVIDKILHPEEYEEENEE